MSENITVSEPRASRGRKSLVNWGVYIEDLKKTPNKFAKLKNLEEVGSRLRYAQWAQAIKNGRLKDFRDSGYEYDAESSAEGLWVRLIDPNSPE